MKGPVRPPGWKRRPRASKYDESINHEQLAADLRDLGTIQDVAKKHGCGKQTIRRLIEKHGLHKAWNDGHIARLDRLDEAKEPERQKQQAAIGEELATAKESAARLTKVLFNSWSIPMSEQKKTERGLAEALTVAKKHQTKLRTLQKRSRA